MSELAAIPIGYTVTFLFLPYRFSYQDWNGIAWKRSGLRIDAVQNSQALKWLQDPEIREIIPNTNVYYVSIVFYTF